METVGSILFLSNASIDLGYEINRVKKFVVRLKGNIMIGGYELSFNQRAQMIYKSSANCSQSLFIRKKNWALIAKEFPYFYKMMKRKSLLLYCNHFRNNINTFKRKEI